MANQMKALFILIRDGSFAQLVYSPGKSGAEHR